MVPIFLLATLAWILALVYYQKCNGLVPIKDEWGWKFVARFFLGFSIGIVVMYLISRNPTPVLSAPKVESGSVPLIIAGLTLPQWAVIVVFACLFYGTFVFLLIRSIKYLSGSRKKLAQILSFLGACIVSSLFTAKVMWNPPIVGNILIFLIILPVLEFAIRLKKSAFIGIFSIIMLLDIFLVWAFNSTPAVAAINPLQVSDGNWYISIFKSKFMQHFPWPIGFRWDGRLLGNGDVFFICLTTMYLKRVWNTRAAILAGVLVTAPLLVLPYVSEALGIYFWPYTIFIAPVALIMAALAPKRAHIAIPQDWQDLDGDIEVIGRPPKS